MMTCFTFYFNIIKMLDAWDMHICVSPATPYLSQKNTILKCFITTALCIKFEQLQVWAWN